MPVSYKPSLSNLKLDGLLRTTKAYENTKFIFTNLVINTLENLLRETLTSKSDVKKNISNGFLDVLLRSLVSPPFQSLGCQLE